MEPIRRGCPCHAIGERGARRAGCRLPAGINCGSETIREMGSAFGADPEQLRVAVGPGIRACCFEVGTEVVEAFNKEFPGCRLSQTVGASPGKYLLDLCMALEIELDKAGIRPEHRYDLGLCTRCNTNEFFSYRAEGMRSGRMMAIIGRLGGKPF
jgi:copper oxidase (laccase) domain-containing protein